MLRLRDSVRDIVKFKKKRKKKYQYWIDAIVP